MQLTHAQWPSLWTLILALGLDCLPAPGVCGCHYGRAGERSQALGNPSS